MRNLKVKLRVNFPPFLEEGTKVVFGGKLVTVIGSSPFGDGATIEYEDGKQEWVDCYIMGEESMKKENEYKTCSEYNEKLNSLINDFALDIGKLLNEEIQKEMKKRSTNCYKGTFADEANPCDCSKCQNNNEWAR